MADADWVRYRQIRGQDLPETLEWSGRRYAKERTLKRDFYAATGLYRLADALPPGDAPAQLLFKVYHEDRFGPIPLGWLGRFLARRERHFLDRLADVPGVPRLLERRGRAGMVREFVPGCNLREHVRAGHVVDAAFFPELAAILAAVHARGISHNDLSKPENVLVTPEGRPVLIDFQIALEFRGPLRPLRDYLQRVDRYHLAKQHRRRRPEDFAPEQIAAARRKGWLLHLHGHLLRKPYRAVRHRLLEKLERE